MLNRKQVRVRVKSGAIFIGGTYYVKGRTFDCDAEYAEQLAKSGRYEILPERTPKTETKKNTTDEVTSGNDI